MLDAEKAKFNIAKGLVQIALSAISAIATAITFFLVAASGAWVVAVVVAAVATLVNVLVGIFVTKVTALEIKIKQEYPRG